MRKANRGNRNGRLRGGGLWRGVWLIALMVVVLGGLRLCLFLLLACTCWYVHVFLRVCMPVSVYDSVWLRMRVHVCTTPCLRTPMCMLLCQRIHSMLLCHNAYTHTHAHPTHASTVTYLNAYIHTPILCIAHKPRNINRPPPLFSPSPVHPTHSIVFVRKFLFVFSPLLSRAARILHT